MTWIIVSILAVGIVVFLVVDFWLARIRYSKYFKDLDERIKTMEDRKDPDGAKRPRSMFGNLKN